jgi:hypothetical protein
MVVVLICQRIFQDEPKEMAQLKKTIRALEINEFEQFIK